MVWYYHFSDHTTNCQIYKYQALVYDNIQSYCTMLHTHMIAYYDTLGIYKIYSY